MVKGSRVRKERSPEGAGPEQQEEEQEALPPAKGSGAAEGAGGAAEGAAAKEEQKPGTAEPAAKRARPSDEGEEGGAKEGAPGVIEEGRISLFYRCGPPASVWALLSLAVACCMPKASASRPLPGCPPRRRPKVEKEEVAGRLGAHPTAWGAAEEAGFLSF